jgi:hypothetical protein
MGYGVVRGIAAKGVRADVAGTFVQTFGACVN